jgi:hypothetical protein
MSPNQGPECPNAPAVAKPFSIKPVIAGWSFGFCVVLMGCLSPTAVNHVPKDYQGRPFQDSTYRSGPQKIPGKVYCAYYDLGGEGVAYHDNTATNLGSGSLNPVNATYLNEFRMKEGADISYVKLHNGIDDNRYDLVPPPDKLLYVGWTEPGE